MSDRPRLGVSACLLGEPVRYNAGHKRDDWLVEVLGPLVEWVAVCPEVEAGFGTPRETMQLVRNADGRIALVTTETARDLSGTMRHFAARRVDELASADLDGYVFKADSPSCGIDHVAVVDGDTASRGLFAAVLMSRLPHLPIVDERRLADPEARRRFIDRVFAHHQARQEAAGGGRATLNRRS